MEKSPHSTVSGTSNRKAPAAYVPLVLDETGSMRDCKGAAIAGINTYLTTLRQMPTPVHFTLTLFNSRKLEVRHRAVPAIQVPELTEQTYQPAESKPLLRCHWSDAGRRRSRSSVRSQKTPDNPFNPINRYDPGNPTNPINQYNPNNPFNPCLLYTSPSPRDS